MFSSLPQSKNPKFLFLLISKDGTKVIYSLRVSKVAYFHYLHFLLSQSLIPLFYLNFGEVLASIDLVVPLKKDMLLSGPSVPSTKNLNKLEHEPCSIQ